jgi:2-iminobutanoate/2-iminopropanoate deaminase
MKRTIVGTLTAALLLSALSLLPGLAQEKPTAREYFSLSEGPSSSPFSTAILVKDTLYISGMIAMDPETAKFEEGPITVQAERIIKNIEIVLKKAGMGLSNVVSTTVFITDFGEFGDFNSVYRKWFPKNPPTRATVQVAALARNAKIEIAAIAVR